MTYGRALIFLIHFYFLLVAVVGTHIENEDEDMDDEAIVHEKVTEKPKLPTCNQEKVLNYLAELQAVSPTAIVNLPIKEDVDQLCLSMAKSLESFDKYVKKCAMPAEPNLYFQLIKGIHSLHKKICRDEKYQSEFLKHLKCYRDLKNEYSDCSGPPDWQESTDKAFVCKSYKAIDDCYFIKTAMLCGKRSARALKEMEQAVINAIITVKCDSVKKEPAVRDAMPDSSNSLPVRPRLLVTLLAVRTIILLPT